MKPMTILWRRLVTNGETCPRCGDTGRELEAAVGKLTVRRLKGIRQVPVWRNELLGDSP